MTIAHIGNTVWDRHTGALTPPRKTIERKANSDGSVKLKGTSRRQESTGQITTTSIVRRESDALLLAQLAGLMQGHRVSVALVGAVFAGVRVDGVEVHHRKIADDRWEVTGRWSFGPTSPEQNDDPKDRLIPTKVETCRVWGEWVERKHLHATTTSEVFGAIGSVMGNALVIQTLDPDAVDTDGEPDTEARTLADVLGHYVRISLPEGTPEEVANATTFAVAWHGRVTNRSLGDDRARVTAGFTCYDLTTLFDVWLLRWYELNDDGIVADGTEIPPFNAMPSGERSSAAPGPDGTYVHDRTRTVGLEWRNSHIAALLVAAYNAQFPDGPTLALAGQTGALDNFQSHDLDGSSVREQLGQMISRGIGCRVVVTAADAVSLHINTGVQAALTAGAWTVPANDRQTTVDLHDLDDLVGWNLDEDISQMADVIAYQMGLPWYCISLGIDDADGEQLFKTWSGADETAWDDLEEQQRDNADHAHIWRRFLLDKDWVGASYKVAPFTINVGRSVATNATHGTSGENGEFSAVGNNRFPWAAVRFTKSLPITVGDDWTADMASGGPGIKPNAALERPSVYAVEDPGGSEKWTRLDMQIVMDDGHPAVILGKDAVDAAAIRDRLQDGQHLVITLGFRLPRPWRVTWRRAPASRLSDQERTVLYQRPDFDYRYLMNQTVVGIKATDLPDLSSAGVIGAKPTIPFQLLGVGRLVHEHPQRGLTWTRQRIDLTAALAPGAFITTATLPYGVDPDPDDDEGPETDRTVNAPIGVRSHNLDREKPSTTWSTTRLAADVVIRPKPAAPAPVIANLAAMVYTA